MGNSKIVYYGETLIDLTGDTVEPAKLLKGVTAHDKSGTLITGTFKAADPYAIISVTYPEGSVCTCSNGSVARHCLLFRPPGRGQSRRSAAARARAKRYQSPPRGRSRL